MDIRRQLANKLEQFVITILKPNLDAKQTKHIAHVMRMAFNAAYDSKPPRWQIGDKFTPKGKVKRECTITNIIRTFTENGNMTTIYRASHDFMGQKMSDTYSETTIARGRICQDTGKVIESAVGRWPRFGLLYFFRI